MSCQQQWELRKHLRKLPRDLQVYLLTLDDDLLLKGLRLNKNFHRRILFYVHQRFGTKLIGVKEATCLLPKYKERHAIWSDSFGYFHFTGRTVHLGCRWYGCHWYADKITVYAKLYASQIKWIDLDTLYWMSAQRKICCKVDPNYPKVHILFYLEELRRYRASDKVDQLALYLRFYIYLFVSAIVIGLRKIEDHELFECNANALPHHPDYYEEKLNWILSRTEPLYREIREYFENK